MTKDPELKQTQGGHSVCTVGVATNRKWTNKQTGELQDQVEFHNIVCWGKVAEIVSKFLRKGSKVYFEGRLQTRMWEKDGHKNYRTEIVAEQMVMLGSKQDGGTRPAPTPAPVATAPAPILPESEKVVIDDLPF